MIDVEEYLNNLFKANKKRTLKAMQYFMNKFQHFEKEMKFIHIAGTNGKGSCTEIIANILEKQGYKVGKFLSPHLIKYNERISINGKEISDEEMSEIIEELQPLIEEYNHSQNTKVTVFELITTMALLYFYRNSVDFVVLETVLGGLDDCTNIITNPVVSVITSIGYDHTKILGDTLTEIAHKKAGIIKENSHTVIFEQEEDINEVFINECNKKNNSLHIVKKSDISNYSFDKDFQHFNYKNFENLSINLKGKMQIQNASICIEVINILNKLGYKVDEKNILEGLKTVIHKGRMEQLSNNPKIIYDGAHNDPAIRNLLDMVDIYYPKLKRVYIISILKRKDYRRMLKLLAKDENAIFVMTSGNDSDRYASKDELYDCMKEFVNSDRIYRKELDVALQDALNTDDDTVNFVVGSLYTYSTVVNKIRKD